MRTRIKICGITNPTDAERAAVLGADAIGLNFYPKSPRYVDASTAESILGALPPFVEPIALFVNRNSDEIDATAPHPVRTVQLHGDQPEKFSMSSRRWIPAFSIRGVECATRLGTLMETWRATSNPPCAVLVDAHVAGMYGGTGQTAPWHLLADFNPGVPVILAGGLTPDNVADAIRLVRPYAVDVASGVESSPGKKDTDRMKRFIDAVHAADVS